MKSPDCPVAISLLVLYTNVAARMVPTPAFEDADTLHDGTRYEMVATRVPESEEYPEGIKCRFQYMTADGDTLLRLDNFPHHPETDRHHYHTPDGAFDDIEYTGLTDHVQTFYRKIDDIDPGDHHDRQ
ncbi:MAG: DUF6516 family protein [Halobaculum sp.]